MNKHIIILIAVAMIGFVDYETILVTSQSNSTNSDRRNIIVTWKQMIQRQVRLPLLVLVVKTFGWFLVHLLNEQLMDPQVHLNNLTFFVD